MVRENCNRMSDALPLRRKWFMKARENEGCRREPFHKIRITACRTTAWGTRGGGSWEGAFQSYYTRRWWKKNVSRGHLIVRSECRLRKGRADGCALKKDGQASPKFDHHRIVAPDLAGDPTKMKAAAATSGTFRWKREKKKKINSGGNL